MAITKTELERFCRPLSVDDIEYVIQFNSKDTSGKTKILPFCSARTIEERLRNDIGIGNYRNYIRPISAGEAGTVFTLEFRYQHDDGVIEWIRFEGVGETSNVAPLKGSASTSLKKCAGFIGLGFELYSFPHIYIDGANLKQIPKWAWKKIKDLTQDIIDKKATDFMYVLTEDNKDQPKQQTSNPLTTPSSSKPTFGKK